MALIHADFCKVCGKRRTNNPDGVCSVCRRSSGSVVCKVCGEHTTQDASGVCYLCRGRKKTLVRKTQDEQTLLQEALVATRQNLYIIEHRIDGPDKLTFAAIGKALGMSSSSVYTRFQSMLSYGSLRIVLKESGRKRMATIGDVDADIEEV